MVTSKEPVVDKNGRYSIRETSEILTIHRHTLRAYVKAGYIHPIMKRATIYPNQTRMRFLGSEILRFWRSFV